MGSHGVAAKFNDNSNEERKEDREERNYEDISDKYKSEADEYFGEMFKEWMKTLSSGEKEDIITYTGGSYVQINEYLREGKMGSGENEYLENLINRATKGLSKFKLKNSMVVYRKSGDEIFNNIFDSLGKELGISLNVGYGHENRINFINEINNLSGSIVKDKGFTSTATRKDVWGGQVWFKIQMPKGTNGAYVRPISLHGSESEFLLNRGTNFKIVSAKMTTDKFGQEHPIVTLKVVKSSGRKSKK